MSPQHVLIANRGEIAIRIARAAAGLGIRTTAVHSADDARSLHTRMADDACLLPGTGAAAYLDVDSVVAAARESGCDAVHPGYGFLSERAALARGCEAAGIAFVGPPPEILDLFGDKVAARARAEAVGVPVLAGSAAPVDLDEARRLAERLGAVVIKAVAGGGGRGMRVVRSGDDLDEAYARCRSEAATGFGDDAVFVERYVERARHVEVQVVGDGDAVVHLGERDCSIQRRHQKIVEIAPAPGLAPGVRDRLHAAALRLAADVGYRSLGTFEFLVDAGGGDDGAAVHFIEANPRLQVEHTVTEEVTGIDLVATQLRLAGGATLADVGLAEPVAPRGTAIQVRINTERLRPSGEVLPTGGTIEAFDMPSGPGVRVDTYGYAGYTTNPSFDPLLAKVITWTAGDDLGVGAAKSARAMSECRIEGVETNVDVLRRILGHERFVAGDLYTGFVDDHLPDLVGDGAAPLARRHFAAAGGGTTPAPGSALAGARIDGRDPLAVLDYGLQHTGAAAARSADAAAADGATMVEAPLQGTVVSIAVRPGDTVRAGELLVVLEAMKMEHEIRATTGGTIGRIAVSVGDTFFAGHPLMHLEPGDSVGDDDGVEDDVDLDHIRDDLREILDRHALVLDDARPAAVARRRSTGHRTARENVEDLVDAGTWVEYGPMVVAAQKRRRTMDELLVKSPADGMITGVGSVNGDLFGDPTSRCVVMAYDYTVFAGTQGIKNHAKTDRLLQVARQGRMPMILFAEGGGGRPGDTDGGDFGTWTFAGFARLSGLVPMVGITTGRCFAGNASVLGCCDVIIATDGSNIGMGGPAMVEGGGLGVFGPTEIGSMSVQVPNGVVDIAVADETEAVDVAKRYLAYFQGRLPTWEAPDQRRMRSIVPENRLRVYDVHVVIETLADRGSVLELRAGFGVGMITALIRVEGRPVGVVANNPAHLGGAIDSDGSDKGARFMQLCDAFDIPILQLCDTPGIMVGPEVEKTALVRHSSRMFLTGANLTVPVFTIVLRKAYGLGAIAMAAASFKQPLFTVAWPTGEFGPMGLEGSVKLGFRQELAGIDDPEERLALYEKLVARAYEKGRAERHATGFAIDDTIDPADSRHWLVNLLASVRTAPRPEGKKRAFIDAW